jgi:ribosome-binding protein aMBF1 (putative translation factor)
MRYSTVLSRLQNLINYKPSQAELCQVLNIKQSTMSNRAVRNSSFTHSEIKTLENYYGVKLNNNELEEADFRLVGKVIKNVSFRL